MALTVPNTFVAGTTAVASEVNDNFAAVKTFVDGLETDITTLETKSPVITLAGDLTGSATLTNLGNATLTATIAANSVALGTDTTGNYVSTITAGTGITGSASSESATPTIAIDAAVVPQLGVANTFTTNQIIEGTTTAALLRITQTGTGNALVVEDETNPDSTPTIIDTAGRIVSGTTLAISTYQGAIPQIQAAGIGASASSFLGSRFSADSNGPGLYLNKSRSATISTQTAVVSGDRLGNIYFNGTDGTSWLLGAAVTGEAEGTISTGIVPGRLIFFTTNSSGAITERMRIDSAGAVSIGSTQAATSLNLTKNISGSVNSQAFRIASSIASGVTGEARYVSIVPSVDASVAAGNVVGTKMFGATLGAGASITSQIAFWAASDITAATNNYGFYGDIPSGTGDYNLYMNGTADNYIAGSVGIGITPNAGRNLEVRKSVTGATEAFSIFAGGNIQSDVTTGASVFAAGPGVAASVTTPLIYHFSSRGVTLGAGSAVTTLGGFVVASSMTQGTNNRGFWGALAAAANTYNLYMAGTADNFLAGKLGVGAAPGGAMAQVVNTTAADKVFVVKGATSQTGYLTDWQNSAGTSLAYVDSSGNAKFVSIDGGSA